MERLEMDILLIRVNACLSSGRFAEARRLLDTVLAEEPAHGVAHGMMGWILWALVDDHARALEHFRCAVRWAPHYANAWMHYLNLLADNGHEQELHEVYMRALHVSGIDRAEVHAIVARYLERSGRPELAVQRYRDARANALTPAADAVHTAAIRRLRARMRRAWWT